MTNDLNDIVAEAYATQGILSDDRWQALINEAADAYLSSVSNLFYLAQYTPCRELLAHQIALHDVNLRKILSLYAGYNIGHADQVATFNAAASHVRERVSE